MRYQTIKPQSWYRQTLSVASPQYRTALRILRPLTVIGKDLWRIFSLAWFKPRLFWLHTSCSLVLFATILSVPMFVLLRSDNANGICVPGGDFVFPPGRILPMAYNPWASNHVFQITIGFGKLSFTQAKVIDVIWDVVVGRGGQFVLSGTTFVVFSKSLNRILERPHAAISYNTFRSIVFEKPSISSTAGLVMDLFHHMTWQARLAMVWFILASSYVVAFPTITSAMTGYSSNVAPFLRGGDGQKVDLTNMPLSQALYQIRDADRIQGLNLSRDYVVATGPFSEKSPTVDENYASCLRKHFTESFYYNVKNNPPKPFNYSNSETCALGIAVYRYIAEYNLTIQNIPSNFTLNATTYHVPPPTLKIDVYNPHLLGYLWLPEVKSRSLPHMYKLSGQAALFSSSVVNSNGTCDSQTTYQWGFSFLLLFSFFIATTIWVAGMYVMWCDAFWHSRLDVAGRHLGFYRGVFDVSDAMWREARQYPDELASNAQIQSMLSRKRNGGRLGYDDINRNNLPLPRSADFAVWRTSIASLNGWTSTWTVVHGFEWLAVLAIGTALHFRATSDDRDKVYYDTNYTRRYSLRGPLLWCIAGLFYFTAAVMFLAGIRGAFQRWWPALRGWTVGGRRGTVRSTSSGADAVVPLTVNAASLGRDDGETRGSG